MSSERKDEFLSWRGRLDSPEGVPGQGLDDHEQTWQRLMDRFRDKPGRRLPVYGIVAACLLLALIPASRLFRDRTQYPRFRAARQVIPQVARPDGGRTGFTSPAPSAPAVGLAEQRVQKRDDRTTKRSSTGRPKTSVRMEMRTIAVTDDTVRTPEVPVVPLVSQLPMTRPVLQRNWKVVDLNDLHAGWQAPHGMASNRPVLSFRIGFGNADPPGNQTTGSLSVGFGSVGSGSTGDPGIKIKLSTSN